MEKPRKAGPASVQSSRGKGQARVFTINPQEVPDPNADMLGTFSTDERI